MAPRTVKLYGDDIQREAAALGEITPGMLIERAPGGVQAHGTAGGMATPSFAVEMGLTGGTIDDAYEADDTVIFGTFASGSAIYALLAIDGNVAVGDFVASDGAGALTNAAAGDIAIAQAIEAVDNTGGSAAVRVRVEVVPAQTVPA